MPAPTPCAGLAPALRVGLVGFGYAGSTFHAPLIRATPGLALVAVASSDAAKVQCALGPAVAVLPVAALIDRDDIDLVVLASPNASHHPLARQALAAGRHVVIDKPFALDAGQAAELLALAESRGLLLSVFHNRRWDSDFIALQQVLADGCVGRPVELASHFDRYRPTVVDRWRERDTPGAGLWMDLGPHLLDQAVQLFGMPDAMALDRARLRPGAMVDDWFSARLRWADGAWAGLRVTLGASMLAAAARPRFALHGLAGSWQVHGLDVQEADLKRGATPASHAPWGHESRSATLWVDGAAEGRPAPLPAGRYPAYYAGIRDALRGLGATPVSAQQALAVQRLLDAGLRSDAARAEINLPRG
ncbi:oxidoreductase [Aquabacterium sp. OR-4]|uniref:oxidoreductase n=1 Tax=Aquabacterium sp. OR-4 TaxID=2978127 RepID=UPI0028C99469|nr:oxidoreductase [Aquabacterium sp. OR-4]MDT7837930.1 oxidoreductase [Aquabacterium sp. OR-4]